MILIQKIMKTSNLSLKLAFIFIVAAIMPGLNMHGQSTIQYCKTLVSAKQKLLENSFTLPQQAINTVSLPQLNRQLSVMVYIVKNDPSNVIKTTITAAMVQQAISDINPYFAPIAVSFKMGAVQTVNNYQLDNIQQGVNEKLLTTQYQTKNCINLYVVSSLTDILNVGAAALTYMPADSSDAIFITKSNFSAILLAHEIGHFLGLYHTFENIFGVEVVSRTANCALAGDRCCDTEADPGLPGLISNNCLYTGSKKDSNNEYYHPSSKNIMSFSNESCQCNFSPMQFQRMAFVLNKFRKYLF